MSVSIIGSGRSGTNMVLEILTGNSYFVPSQLEEDKWLCRRDNEVYPDNYLTKCDIAYMNYYQLKNMLTINPRMKVIWTIRDPRDLIMSKMYRSQPYSEGGDCPVLADEATFEGCLLDIENMLCMYKKVIVDFVNRVLLVKMEDVINDVVKETHRICNFVGVDYNDNMIKFYERMRNRFKYARYKSIDRNEFKKYLNWQTAYDGFFVKNNYDMESFFKNLYIYIKYFNYE